MGTSENPSTKSLKIASRRRFVRDLIVGASGCCVTPNLLDWSMGMSERSRSLPESHEAAAVMDQALEMLANKGPEYGPGLSNHGPMAAEALIRMGRHEAVMPWVEQYKRNLQSRPDARNLISKKEW